MCTLSNQECTYCRWKDLKKKNKIIWWCYPDHIEHRHIWLHFSVINSLIMNPNHRWINYKKSLIFNVLGARSGCWDALNQEAQKNKTKKSLCFGNMNVAHADECFCGGNVTVVRARCSLSGITTRLNLQCLLPVLTHFRNLWHQMGSTTAWQSPTWPTCITTHREWPQIHFSAVSFAAFRRN